MDNPDWIKLLADKDQLIKELRFELEETNKGILHLVMELEYAAERKYQEEHVEIEQLQTELAETDQGLLALATELELAKEKYKDILEHAREAIITFDQSLKIETWNAATQILFGYENEDLTNIAMTRLIPYFDDFFSKSSEINAQERSFLKTRHDQDYELYGKHKHNISFPIEMTLGTPFYNEKQTWMVIVRDISERKETEQKLKLMAKVFQENNNAIMITDKEGIILEVNSAFTTITGYEAKEVIAKCQNFIQFHIHDTNNYQHIWESLTHFGFWNGEVLDQKKNGDIYPKALSISAVKDKKEQIIHYIAAFTDITHRKAVESKLLHLAHYDQLTGLPNRAFFIQELQLSLETARSMNQNFALMFLDLDRFKIINDTLGHHIGDQLLIEVAERLKNTIRKSDLVARLAGDEFTILLSGINDQNVIVEIANKILQILVKPILLADREIYISGSLGIALFPNDGEELQSLIKNADIAMYHAKAQGKNTYAFYSGIMIAHLQNQLELENYMRKALANGEFRLVYQPQISLIDQRIVGVEALIRWQHPTLGNISPDIFIKIAEQTGLIIDVGNWVLTAACRQFMQWQKTGCKPIKISVNYSGVQLKLSNQIENISAILAVTGMDPHFLCLEMTESVAMEDAENTIKTLREFKNMGISISIDDFGTGYSSLSYLKRFPIDTLKIDRSFITDIIEKSDDSAIASTIIAIAHQLRLSVIAEGVETLDQLRILKNQGCDQIQGYFYCPPVSGDEMIKFMASHNSKIGKMYD